MNDINDTDRLYSMLKNGNCTMWLWSYYKWHTCRVLIKTCN